MAQTETKQSRREFLVGLGIVGAVVVAIGTFAVNVFAFLFPGKQDKTFHKYLVAKEGEIPVGKAKEITLSNKPVFVVLNKKPYLGWGTWGEFPLELVGILKSFLDLYYIKVEPLGLNDFAVYRLKQEN